MEPRSIGSPSGVNYHAAHYQSLARDQIHSILNEITCFFFEVVQPKLSEAQEFIDRELKYVHKDLTQSVHYKALYELFSQVMVYMGYAAAEDSAQGRVSLEEASAEKIIDGIQNLEKVDIEVPVPEWLDNPESLRKLSLLKQSEEDCTLEVTGSVLKNLVSAPKPGQAAFSELAKFYRTYLEECGEKNLPDDAALESLFSGVKKQTELRREIARKKEALLEKEVSLQENNAWLRGVATEFAQKVHGVQAGQTFFYEGVLGRPPSFQITEEQKKYIENSIGPELTESLVGLSSMSSQDLTKKVKERMLTNGGIKDSTDALGKILGGIDGYIDFGKTQLKETVSDEWYETIASSVQEALREALMGKRAETEDYAFSERLWDHAEERGLKSAADHFLDEIVEHNRESLIGSLDSFRTRIGSTSLPLPHHVVESLGLSLNPQSRFSLEFKVEEDGTYTLTLFSNSLNGDVHALTKGRSHCPIVIRGVAKEKLDRDFFFRLVSYQAWPEWDTGPDYTLRDLFEGPLRNLGGKEDEVAANILLPVELQGASNGADWLKRYFYPKVENNDRQKNYSLVMSYELELDALCNSWPRINLNDQETRVSVETLVNKLGAQAVDLYIKKQLSEDQFKKTYATLWEIKRALAPLKKQKAVYREQEGIVVPKDYEDKLRALLELGGFSPRHMAAIQEFAKDILGEEAGESLSRVLDEMIPETAEYIPNYSLASLTVSQLLGIDRLKLQAQRVRDTDSYLLKVIRATSYAVGVLEKVFYISIAARALELWLAVAFPQLRNLRYISLHKLSMLIVYFGPVAVAKFLPDSVYRTFLHGYSFFREVTHYPFRRLKLAALKYVCRSLIDQESCKQSVKKLEESVTGKGELSLDIEALNPQPKKISFAPPPEQSESELVKETAWRVKNGQEQLNQLERNPYPEPVTLTKKNVQEVLDLWLKKAEEIDKRVWFEPFADFFSEQLRDLPIPGTEGGKVWDEYENPEELLEQLHLLLLRLDENARKQKNKQCTHDTVEYITNFYTLYAVIDRVARRCAKGSLPAENPANGQYLAKFMSNSSLTINNLRTYDKLVDLAQYFGFKPFKRYSDEEIHALFAESLLDSPRYNCIQSYSSFHDLHLYKHSLSYAGQTLALQDPPLLKYLKKQLKNPEVQGRLGLYGVEGGDDEKLKILWRDPSIRQRIRELEMRCLWKKVDETATFEQKQHLSSLASELEVNERLFAQEFLIEKNKCDLSAPHPEKIEKYSKEFFDKMKSYSGLKSDEPFLDVDTLRTIQLLQGMQDLSNETNMANSRLGVLPRDFYILRLAHLTAQEFASPWAPVERVSYDLGLIKNNQRSVYGKEPIKYKEYEPLNRGFKERSQHGLEIIDSSVNYARTYSTIPFFGFELSSSPQGWFVSPEVPFVAHFKTPSKSPYNDSRLSLESTWDAVHRGRGRLSDSLERSRMPYLLGKWFAEPSQRSQAEIMSQPESLAGLVELKENRILLEMIFQDKKDQIVRTLDFFTKEKEYLRRGILLQVFRLLMTDTQALDAQLKERPEIAIDIGKFFTQRLKDFELEENSEIYTTLCRSGMEVLTHCKRYYPKAEKFFPNFAESFQRHWIDPLVRDVSENRSNQLITDRHMRLISLFSGKAPSELSQKEKELLFASLAYLLFVEKQHQVYFNSRYYYEYVFNRLRYQWKRPLFRSIPK